MISTLLEQQEEEEDTDDRAPSTDQDTGSRRNTSFLLLTGGSDGPSLVSSTLSSSTSSLLVEAGRSSAEDSNHPFSVFSERTRRIRCGADSWRETTLAVIDQVLEILDEDGDIMAVPFSSEDHGEESTPSVQKGGGQYDRRTTPTS